MYDIKNNVFMHLKRCSNHLTYNNLCFDSNLRTLVDLYLSIKISVLILQEEPILTIHPDNLIRQNVNLSQWL